MTERIKRPIPFPGTPSEFEIQSYLFTELKCLGMEVRGEVRIKSGRLDIVVYKDVMFPIRVIEVKKHGLKGISKQKYKMSIKAKIRRQVKRYKELGVPVDLVCTMKQAKRYLSNISKRGFSEVSEYYW